MSLSSDISTISSSLNAIKNAIIEKGVIPAGDITTYAEAISQIQAEPVETTKYGVGVGAFLGDVDADGVLQRPVEQYDLILNGVKAITTENRSFYQLFYRKSGIRSMSCPDLEEVSGYAFYNCFYESNNLETVSFPKLKKISGGNNFNSFCNLASKIRSASFDSLEEINGSQEFSNAFAGCSSFESLSMPNLKRIIGTSAMGSICRNTNVTRLDFPKLEFIDGSNALNSIVSGTTNFQHIYFNALNSNSFGSTYNNQISSLFTGTGTEVMHTVHFPSNLQSVVSNLLSYPLFGGTSGYVTVAFDLPATS